MTTCYNNIIGIARADCPCIPTDPPSGYNTSTSGLYLTDVAPFDSLQWDENCTDGSIWDLSAKAVSQAVTTFVADTNALLMRKFSPKREKFKGQIGEATGRETFNTEHTYAGNRLAFNPIRGGVAKITHIGTLFNGAGTVELNVYNALNELVATRTVDVLNGWKLNALSTPITLETYIEFSPKHEYFIVYTYNASNKPRQNNINCGCGGFVPWFDTNKPMWAQHHPGNRSWANWVQVGGWSGDTLTDFDQTANSTSTQMNGLALQIELGCDVGQVLCNGSLDFETDPFALSIAYAIRYKAWELLAARLLSSNTITRQTVVNREMLQALKKEWNASYAENVNYITQEAQVRQNDCLACRDESGFQVQTIFS